MRTVKLDVQQYTGTGTAHAELTIDGNNVGMLYLTPDEFKLLSEALRESSDKDDKFMFSVDEPIEDDQEIDIDIFD